MTLTENLLRATLLYLQRDEAGQDRTSKKRFVGIQADRWIGPRSLQIGDEQFEVQECRSPLAVRAAMDSWHQHDKRLVLVTPCGTQELGCDVEARVLRNRFHRADPWQAVMAHFGADRIDPSAPRRDWVRELLLGIPNDQLPRLQTSTVLDADTVWTATLSALGIPSDGQLQDLLVWTNSPRAASLRDRSPELHNEVLERVARLGGPTAAALVRGVLAGHGVKMAPLGLIVRALLTAKTQRGTDAAALARIEGKLAQFVPGPDLELETLEPWATAAESLLASSLATAPSAAKAMLELADELLDELGAVKFAAGSNFLRAGLLLREQAVATELAAALADRSRDTIHTESAIAAVLEHALVPTDRKGRDGALRMAGRLLRWLRTTSSPASNFEGLAFEYATCTSYVDFARERLDYSGPLQSQLRELWLAVQERRETSNKIFGEAFAREAAAPGNHRRFIRLEDALHEVVAPIAEHSPVLLVVLDGASLGIFHEIIGGLSGWDEVGPEGEPDGVGQRRYGIAVMPTITSVSRTSLFCGKVTDGDQAVEKVAFAAHDFLRGKMPPVLFHKDDLSGDRLGLSDTVAKAIAGDRSPQVVAVVVNAIDDWLSKGDQDAAVWTIERIKPLNELLQLAATNNRVLVITSDHGHVREHATQFAREGAGSRHRFGSEPANSELVFKGARVHSPNGVVIAPWSEKLRYTRSKQHGYHGGATPQEVLVPLSVFVPADSELNLPGFEMVAAQQPEWWEPTLGSTTPKPVRAPTPKGHGRKPASKPSAILPFGNARQDLVIELVQSDIYRAQAEAAGKMRVADERVQAILFTLAEAGGSLTRKALAAKLGLPEMRLHGSLMGLRRILNVDGIEVLQIDRDSDDVRIIWELLRTQFELGGN